MRRLLPILATAAVPAFAAEISFNRDIRPILSDYCYACHGFDKHTRKGDLRLDTAEGATALVDGVRAIVPGDPHASEAIKRILSDDPEEVMPPPKTKKKLKPEQLAVLKEWIKQGAKYEGHWAFTPPARPAVPPMAGVANPIDAFIRSKLKSEGLAPSPAADKVTQLRRVTYDLTGLPPTPAEVEAFAKDTSPDAYEKAVDRLIASPRYGEKMAVNWLDLSRYADTHGYHLDSGRDMWLWRDWVIDSFNRNQRFDEFVRWQLAGDLLPEQLPQQRLATGFVRNNMINFEGGAIAEEYLNAYVVDRVNTVGTVFLGLSVNCAQCHDHKYDPLTTKEFYQLYAYFNAVPERGLDGNKGNAAPVMRVPSAEQSRKLDELTKKVAAAEKALEDARKSAAAKQAEWEKSLSVSKEPTWTVVAPAKSESAFGTKFVPQNDGSVVASAANPAMDEMVFTIALPKAGVTGLRLEALADASMPDKGPGRASNGNFVMTNLRVEDAADGRKLPISRVAADYEQATFPASYVIDANEASGWAVDGNERHENRTLWAEFAQPVSVKALRVTLSFKSQFAAHSIGRPRLAVTTDAKPVPANRLPAEVAAALAVPQQKRTDKDRATISKYYLAGAAPELQSASTAVDEAKKALAAAEKEVPNVMVMEQMKEPRETRVRVRGDYATLGDKVEPGVPASLGALPADAPKDRRALAAWLTDRKHPLLARVTVNRLWRNIFGTGIVKTVNDFGLQGEWPSHPELLDWLAVEFMEKGWDVKGLIRLMVTSETYRQSTKVTPAILARDPENRLLARGPRFRLSAEEIRDTALAVSGLLNPKIGGASVYPYQPAGIWEELSSRGDSRNWSAQFYEQSHGDDLYRRSLYTFIKRTCPPPQMQTFDAPDREVCTAQRDRTNTPLQALVTLNDPTYMEASRMLAERILREAPGLAKDKVKWAFRAVTAREPSEREVSLLADLYEKQRQRFQGEPEAANKVLANGEKPRDAKLPVAEVAAWTIVANTILNLDETLTRG